MASLSDIRSEIREDLGNPKAANPPELTDDQIDRSVDEALGVANSYTGQWIFASKTATEDDQVEFDFTAEVGSNSVAVAAWLEEEEAPLEGTTVGLSGVGVPTMEQSNLFSEPASFYAVIQRLEMARRFTPTEWEFRDGILTVAPPVDKDSKVYILARKPYTLDNIPEEILLPVKQLARAYAARRLVASRLKLSGFQRQGGMAPWQGGKDLNDLASKWEADSLSRLQQISRERAPRLLP